MHTNTQKDVFSSQKSSINRRFWWICEKTSNLKIPVRKPIKGFSLRNLSFVVACSRDYATNSHKIRTSDLLCYVCMIMRKNAKKVLTSYRIHVNLIAFSDISIRVHSKRNIIDRKKNQSTDQPWLAHGHLSILPTTKNKKKE